MRDAFGEIDPDEIDIIDADPAAFGQVAFGGDAGGELGGDGEPFAVAGRRRGRRWLVPAIAASAVGLVAVGVLVWQPWADDDSSLSFPTRPDAAATLTEELVFDDPPAPVTAASLGQPDGLGGDTFSFLEEAVGYFFAEPGAAFDPNGSDASWAVFASVPEGSDDAPEIDPGDNPADGTADTVQGAPASIDSSVASLIEIEFGPVDGRYYSVATSGMTLADSLAFAEAVAVAGGVPTITDSTVLQAMQPLGSIADYSAGLTLMFAASGFDIGIPTDGVVTVQYGDDPDTTSVSSRAATSDTLIPMLRFLMGATEEHTVHGLPAAAVDAPAANDMLVLPSGSLTAWVEGGRLVLVTAPGDIDSTLALAETVRPATDDEWAEVVQAAADAVNPLDEWADIENLADGTADPLDEVAVPQTTGVVVAQGIDSASGLQYELAVTFDNGNLEMCVGDAGGGGASTSCGETAVELPLLTTQEWQGHRFVLAMVARDEAADPELRYTLADGTVEVRALSDFGDELPGPAKAVLLPDDAGTVELWNGGELVAAFGS